MNAITSRAWPWKTALRATALGLAAGAMALVLGSSPARAGDRFENGFENQLGRLAVIELFHVGRHLVNDSYTHQQVAWRDDARYRSDYRNDRTRYRRDYRHDHHRGPQYYGLRHGSWRMLDHFHRHSSQNARYQRIVRVNPAGKVKTVYERPHHRDYCQRHGRYFGRDHGRHSGHGYGH